MANADIKNNIQNALMDFASINLTETAIRLFATLGYNTDRQASLSNPTFEEFRDSYIEGNPRFNEKKAIVEEWNYVDLLFQISEEEITKQANLFNSKKVVTTGDSKIAMESYLFFAIGLSGSGYTRTTLSQITREINKVFSMPVMLLFKYGQSITLAVINRRLHKRDEQKDVLEKITLIKDISIQTTHRAHIEILYDLSFPELQKKHKVTNFVELHEAWQKTLDIKELNKRFYQELANWYFWAMDHVTFPDDVEKDKSVLNATSLIRLITRIIFIWFIKEKSLVPEALFNKGNLKKILKEFGTNNNSRSYYNVILQNLFFGTLNQKMHERGFAKEGSFQKNKSNYGIKNLFRYTDMFAISEKEALALFKDIPFLNGGLFDCLDKEDEAGKVLYTDGFSRNPKKQAIVPDFLFFSPEHEYDLNTVYGTKNKHYKIKGLIDILSGYKFTITENTPIEEEIALDPELLGKVFENLLASYNPETQTTARKQTGSFYTPREIVNYMVDESLKAYLKQGLSDKLDIKEEDADTGLDILFSYTEREHAFSDKETNVLINAIDSCKILDPACGSGAFPMGILHKLVHILHKLDPKNEQWKERQLNKAGMMDDPAIRDHLIADIESAFENNELDYGRKLYLIENCIYGVDIQPIAVQIAKLRFFISLIVDQRKHPDKENLGIRALPNLETKFVAANTLIGLEKPNVQRLLFENKDITVLEDKLKALRHRYFAAKTRKEKMACQKEDKSLRQKIAGLLEKDGWGYKTAEQIVTFDPYDQNASSSFFDPEWMFGVSEGYDIIIGNPPYIKEDVFKNAFDGVRDLKCYQGKMDIWYLFGAKALDILVRDGVLCLIATNNWISNDGASKFRDKINTEGKIKKYVDFGNFKIFSAGIQTMVFVVIKSSTPESYIVKYKKIINEKITDDIIKCILENEITESPSDFIEFEFKYNRTAFKGKYINFTPVLYDQLFKKILKQSLHYLLNEEIFSGIDVMQDSVNKAHLNNLGANNKIGDGIFVLSDDEFKNIKWNAKELNIIKPFFTTKEINRYLSNNHNMHWVLYTSASINKNINLYPNIKKHLDQYQNIITSVNKPYGLHRTRDEEIFLGEKILSIRKCETPSFSFSNYPCYVSRTFLIIKSNRFNLKYIVSILNSKTISFWLWHKGKIQGNNYQIDKEPLMQIPIVYIERFVNSISVIHDYRMFSKFDEYNLWDSIIDAIVYELYFPNEIQAANCEILKHFKSLPDLQDNWDYKKKLAIIEKAYKELSDLKHPVSIAMEKMKTIPEIKIIEGGIGDVRKKLRNSNLFGNTGTEVKTI
jgi:adenine-specific DNA-methyltransferase